MFPESGEAKSSKLALAALGATATAFVTLRLAYLLVREPFFDELFTLWITRRGLAQLFAAVAVDSGPPLYYLLTTAASFLGSSIALLRVVSLLCGALALVAIVKARLPLRAEMLALLFITILPLHIHYSTEARAYALCGSAIGLACVALHLWRRSGGTKLLSMAVAALLVAAYSHYYGVLAFPLLLAAALIPGSSFDTRVAHRIRSATVATIALAILFIPGFLLAASQPVAAREWMANGPFPLTSALRQLSIAGDFIVMPAAPLLLQLIGVVTIGTVVIVTARRRETWWWGVATLLPLVATSLLSLVGVGAYFPARFESVLLVPFAIWLAVAISLLPSRVGRVAVVVIVAVALLTTGNVLFVYARGGEDPYRTSATVAAEVVPSAPIVVSGLSYLELVTARRGATNVIALPAEQAAHPGWRAVVNPTQLEREVAPIAARHERIFWLGELGTPEMRAIDSRYHFAALYRNGRLVLLYGKRK